MDPRIWHQDQIILVIWSYQRTCLSPGMNFWNWNSQVLQIRLHVSLNSELSSLQQHPHQSLAWFVPNQWRALCRPSSKISCYKMQLIPSKKREMQIMRPCINQWGAKLFWSRTNSSLHFFFFCFSSFYVTMHGTNNALSFSEQWQMCGVAWSW